MAGVASARINVAGEVTKYMTSHVKSVPVLSTINGVETITQVSDGGKEQTTNQIMLALIPKKVDPSAGYSTATVSTAATATIGPISSPPNTSTWSQTAVANAEQQQVPIVLPSDNTGLSGAGNQIDTTAGGLGGIPGLRGFASPSSGQLTPQWYFVTANTASTGALTQCSSFGGKLATMDQIIEAQENGASVYQWGWYGDTETVVKTTEIAYPRNIVYSTTNIASVQAGNSIGVNCFGIKPPKGTTNVAPWTDTEQVANTSSYVAGDWSMRVGGDGGYMTNPDGTASVPGTPLRTQEVYWVGFKNAFSHDKADAQRICQAAGGDLATLSQLKAAQENGAQWCFAGWLKDTVNPHYPMQQARGGCGDKAGVIDKADIQLAGANCVGVKPTKTPTMILLPNGNLTQTVTVNKPGRYVRVRGSLTSGEGWIHFSQIVVKGANGAVISQGKPTFYNPAAVTRWNPGTSMNPAIAVDGREAVRNWGDGGVFHSNNTSVADDTQYWEVDLGSSQQISTITYYGRGDCCYGGTGEDRITGTRIEVAQTPVPLPFSSYSAPSAWLQSSYVNTNKCAANTTATVCNDRSVCLKDGDTCSTCSGTMQTYGGVSVCDTTGGETPMVNCPAGSTMAACNNVAACVPAGGDCAGAVPPRAFALDQIPSDITPADFIAKCNRGMTNINTLTSQYKTPLTVNRASWPRQPVNTFATPAITYISNVEFSSSATASKIACCYGGTPVKRNVYLTGIGGEYPDNKVNAWIGNVNNLMTKEFTTFSQPYTEMITNIITSAAKMGARFTYDSFPFFPASPSVTPFDSVFVCPAPKGSACANATFTNPFTGQSIGLAPDNDLCFSGSCNPTTYLCDECTADAQCPVPRSQCINKICKKPNGATCSAADQCLIGSCTDNRCMKPHGSQCTAARECAGGACIANKCGKPGGAQCTATTDCAAGTCTNGTCGNANGAQCNANRECTTGSCSGGKCGKPTGALCTAANECAAGSCTAGKCGVIDGGACTSSSQCAGGSCINSKCAKPVGARCTTATECAVNSCINSKCAKQNGDPCSANNECAVGSCTNGTCGKPVGAQCATANECVMNSCINGRCVKPTGAQCTAANECALGYCTAGVCKKPFGTQCSAADECESSRCVNGRCKRANGSLCTTADECEIGVCTNTKCGRPAGAQCATFDECAVGSCSTGRCRQANGSICTVPEECVGNYCTAGVCKKPAGARCEGVDDCEDGTCMANICKKLAGTSCATSNDCAKGICENGKCMVQLGVLCNTDAECSSGRCRRGTCTLGLGDPCMHAADCDVGSCSNGKCGWPGGSNCISNSECTSGICRDNNCDSASAVQTLDATNIALTSGMYPCTSGDQCITGICTDGRCGKPLNSPCTSGQECANGGCREGRCKVKSGGRCNGSDDCELSLGPYSVCINNVCGKPGDYSCSSADECASKICIDGKCGLPNGSICKASNPLQCRVGYCTDGICSYGTPTRAQLNAAILTLRPAGVAKICTRDTECPAYQVCTNGICGTAPGGYCYENNNCLGGYCDVASHACGKKRRAPCSLGVECEKEYCTNGFCEY